MVSERLENARETGYALSSRYAFTSFDQLNALRMLSYIEKPSAESMDSVVASLQEHQDKKIERYPSLYKEVVEGFLGNPTISEKHRLILKECLEKSQEKDSEEEKREYERSIVAIAKNSEKHLWDDIDEMASKLSLDCQADVFVGYLQNENVTDDNDKVDAILAQSKRLFRYSHSNLIKVAQTAASSYRTSSQAAILREAAEALPARNRDPIIRSVDEHALARNIASLNPLKRKKGFDDGDKSPDENTDLPDRSRKRLDDDPNRPTPSAPVSGRSTPHEQQGTRRTTRPAALTARNRILALAAPSRGKGKGKARTARGS
jgi:hypothetical protein